jgi:hypothetical protein
MNQVKWEPMFSGVEGYCSIDILIFIDNIVIVLSS